MLVLIRSAVHNQGSVRSLSHFSRRQILTSSLYSHIGQYGITYSFTVCCHLKPAINIARVCPNNEVVASSATLVLQLPNVLADFDHSMTSRSVSNTESQLWPSDKAVDMSLPEVYQSLCSHGDSLSEIDSQFHISGHKIVVRSWTLQNQLIDLTYIFADRAGQ